MPGSKAGRLLAGLLAGMINAVLRWHGYLPEGVVPAVLAVNLLAPTLDRMAFVMRGWHNRFCTATRSQIVF
jgi:Na+-translocating ferredoxin:NAD+ oxidoreductase RnfD subunit